MIIRLNYVQLRRVFFGICIPFRVVLAFLYHFVDTHTVGCGIECAAGYMVIRLLLGLFLVAVMSMLLYTELKGGKKRGFFGGLTWWNNIRILHVFNYFGASVLVFTNTSGAQYFLFADAAVAVAYAMCRNVFLLYA